MSVFIESANNINNEAEFTEEQFILNEIDQIRHHCRLHCFISNRAKCSRNLASMRKLLTADQRRQSIITPHVIINAKQKSQFAEFFNKDPNDSLQFAHVTVKNLNEANSSPPQPFSSNSELSQYLYECAMETSNNNKLQISGQLCGDLAYNAHLSHLSNMIFTFDCSVSPSTVANELEYIKALTESVRSSDDADNFTSDVRDGVLERFESSQNLFEAREARKLEEEQPDLE